MAELEHHLKHSGNYSLSLTLRLALRRFPEAFDISPLDIRTLTCSLKPHLNRVQHLDLDIESNSTEASAIFPWSELSSANPETIRIDWMDGTIPSSFILPSRRLSAITIISHGYDYLSQLLMSGDKLRYLNMIIPISSTAPQDCLRDIIPVLRFHAATLVELHACLPPSFNYRVGSYDPIIMPSLEFLSLISAHASPLICITAPCLKNVQLRFGQYFKVISANIFTNSIIHIATFLQRHGDSLESVSFGAQVYGELPKATTTPIHLPKLEIFRIQSNVGQKTLLSACRFQNLVELVVDIFPSKADDDLISYEDIAACIAPTAHSLLSVQISYHPTARRDCDSLHPNDLISTPFINLPVIESISLIAGGNLMSKVASAPLLQKLVITMPNETHPALTLWEPVMFPCLEHLEVEYHFEILHCIVSPSLQILRLSGFTNHNDDVVVSFIAQHAPTLIALYLSYCCVLDSPSLENDHNIHLPCLEIFHLDERWFGNPTFMPKVSTFIRLHLMNDPSCRQFEEGVTFPENILPFRQISMVTRYGWIESYQAAIIRSVPSLETLRFDVQSWEPHMFGIVDTSDVDHLIATLGEPDPKTGAWFCPRLQHIIVDIMSPDSMFDFDALQTIITARINNPDVVPLKSLTVRRKAMLEDPDGISPWVSPPDDLSVTQLTNSRNRLVLSGPSGALREWFTEHVTSFECLCLPVSEAEWFEDSSNSWF